MLVSALITGAAFVVPAMMMLLELSDMRLPTIFDADDPQDHSAVFIDDIASLFPGEKTKDPVVQGDPDQSKPNPRQSALPQRRAEQAVKESTAVAKVDAAVTPDAKVRATPASRSAAARAAAGRPTQSTNTKKSRSGQKKQRCAEPTEDIVQLSENEYSITRELVMDYASDLERASRLAYVDWYENDKGKVDGFQVRHIRCGTVLDQAGLKNGDVIREVNGKAVKSIMTAWGAWRKVKKKDVVRVQVMRKGQRFEIRYHIT